MTPPTPFALGTFSASDGQPFAGLVLGERVVDLGSAVTVRALVERWDESLPRLQAEADRLVQSSGAREHALGELRPLPPVQPPGQVFQAGANYRQHVLDLLAGAERRGDSSDGLTSADRDRARAELDHRLQHGKPFVFMGSANSMVGANDDVVLPFDSDQCDWELELAVVIGRVARRVPRERALDVVAGYTICNDLTVRDALVRPDAGFLGLDWLAGKNAPTFLPTGPLHRPGRPHRRPDGRPDRAESQRAHDAGRDDRRHGVRRRAADRTRLPRGRAAAGRPAADRLAGGERREPRRVPPTGDVIDGTITGLGRQRNHCVAEARKTDEEAA